MVLDPAIRKGLEQRTGYVLGVLLLCKGLSGASCRRSRSQRYDPAWRTTHGLASKPSRAAMVKPETEL